MLTSNWKLRNRVVNCSSAVVVQTRIRKCKGRVKAGKLEIENFSGGWSTLETIFITPVVVMLIAIIFFVGGYFSAKLQLINAASAAAIVAGLKDPIDCGGARGEISRLFAGNVSGFSCTADRELVTIKTNYLYASNMPYLEGFAREINVVASAARAQKVKD